MGQISSVVTCKPGVRFGGFTAGLCRILSVLVEMAEDGLEGMPPTLVITSGSDHHHPPSRHVTFEAIDIRSKTFATVEAKERFRAAYERRLGPQFTVLLECLGESNEHFHAQVKKGHTYISEWE